jgi:hypothetical protein
VGQPSHCAADAPVVQDFSAEEIDGHRQASCSQQLFVDGLQDFLRRDTFQQPFTIDAKEVFLFDIFFAIERLPGHATVVPIE